MKRFVQYIASVRKEAGKVVWPDRVKIKKDTIAVICVCTFFSLMFWAVNSGTLALIRAVLGKAL